MVLEPPAQRQVSWVRCRVRMIRDAGTRYVPQEVDGGSSGGASPVHAPVTAEGDTSWLRSCCGIRVPTGGTPSGRHRVCPVAVTVDTSRTVHDVER